MTITANVGLVINTQKKPDFYGGIGFCVGIRSASKERIYTGREVKKKIVSGRRRCGLYYILFLIGKRGRTLFVSNSWPSCSSSIWIGYPMLCLYLPPTPPSLYTAGLNNNARRLGPLPLLAFFFRTLRQYRTLFSMRLIRRVHFFSLPSPLSWALLSFTFLRSVTTTTAIYITNNTWQKPADFPQKIYISEGFILFIPLLFSYSHHCAFTPTALKRL